MYQYQERYGKEDSNRDGKSKIVGLNADDVLGMTKKKR